MIHSATRLTMGVALVNTSLQTISSEVAQHTMSMEGKAMT